MNKLERSWSLFKSSVTVIGQNKRLLIFPIVTFLFTIIIALFFLAPAVLWPTGHSYTSAEHWKTLGNYFMPTESHGSHGQVKLPPAVIAYTALLYLVSMFFATFFNVAFYH